MEVEVELNARDHLVLLLCLDRDWETSRSERVDETMEGPEHRDPQGSDRSGWDQLRFKMNQMNEKKYREPWRGAQEQKILWVSHTTAFGGRALVIQGVSSRQLKQDIIEAILSEPTVHVRGVLVQWGQYRASLYSAQQNQMTGEELLERAFKGGRREQSTMTEKQVDPKEWMKQWRDQSIEIHREAMFEGGVDSTEKQQDRKLMAMIEKGKRERSISWDRESRKEFEEKRKKDEERAKRQREEESDSEEESESEDSEAQSEEDMEELMENGGWTREEAEQYVNSHRRSKRKNSNGKEKNGKKENKKRRREPSEEAQNDDEAEAGPSNRYKQDYDPREKMPTEEEWDQADPMMEDEEGGVMGARKKKKGTNTSGQQSSQDSARNDDNVGRGTTSQSAMPPKKKKKKTTRTSSGEAQDTTDPESSKESAEHTESHPSKKPSQQKKPSEESKDGRTSTYTSFDMDVKGTTYTLTIQVTPKQSKSSHDGKTKK